MGALGGEGATHAARLEGEEDIAEGAAPGEQPVVLRYDLTPRIRA